MTTYTWKIVGVNSEMRTMEVMYTNEDKVTTLNLHVPPEGHDVGEWVDKFAPRTSWEPSPMIAVTVGTEGTANITLPAQNPSPSQSPQSSPPLAMNEEYLRALIYQIIEEISAAA